MEERISDRCNNYILIIKYYICYINIMLRRTYFNCSGFDIVKNIVLSLHKNMFI